MNTIIEQTTFHPERGVLSAEKAPLKVPLPGQGVRKLGEGALTSRFVAKGEQVGDWVAYQLSGDVAERLKEQYKDLPVGAALIGGAARQVAFARLIGAKVGLRDVDVTVFSDMTDGDLPDDDKLEELSMQFMPDDFAFGHGIEIEESAEYFKSRDFTINQLAVVKNSQGWRLLMTMQAMLDLPRGAIRPTIAVHRKGTRGSNDSDDNYYLDDKLAIKALLLKEVLIADGIATASIESINMHRYTKEYYFSPFHVGLGMQKALERGGDIPERFAVALHQHGFTDSADVNGIVAQVERETDFEFRGKALETLATRRKAIAINTAE